VAAGEGRWQPRDFCLYSGQLACALDFGVAGWRERNVPIFSSVIFGAVKWAARKGLRGEREDARGDEELPEKKVAARKLEARRTGVRGETYAYWYLRRQGYVFVARNYMPGGAKGEIDLIGYDGKRWCLSRCERAR